MTPSRLTAVLFVTLIECPAVYAWLRLDDAGHSTLGILILVVGETLESGSLPGIMLAAPADPAQLADARVRAHLRRVRTMAFLAIPAEIVVWLTWRSMVGVVGLAASIPVLLILMHLKHQMETAAVRGTPFKARFFAVPGTFASACETAGAVGCLALIRDGRPWLGAAALVGGILVEHWILIGALQREMRLRDLGLPRASASEARRAPRRRAWRRQGLGNTIQLWTATHFPRLWRLVGAQWSPLRSSANRFIINSFAYRMRPRPAPLSTLAPYTSWVSLTDRRYSARHLPPASQRRTPSAAVVEELFHLDGVQSRMSAKSTLLFPHFAQWFTDGFLHTDPRDARRNMSTHDIDLSQLYGQTPEVTDMLRGPDGRLKSEAVRGREFPPRYMDDNGRVKPEFKRLALTYPGSDRKLVAPDLVAPGQPPRSWAFGRLRPRAAAPPDLDLRRRQALFALGLPRGNMHYGLVMMSTVFLREHNRLAGLLRARHHRWTDDEVFQTARNTLTVMLLKIVIQDYINHISPLRFRVFWELGLGARERWFRENWMSIEFDLLYRWHALVPEHVQIHGARRPTETLLWDNDIVTRDGIAGLFDEASRQPSAEIGLLNTPRMLWPVERRTIEIGRLAQLGGYNDYREACGYPRLSSFNDVSNRPAVREALAERYSSVDEMDLYVGLFAEDVVEGGALPTLMGTMVGCDAFTQALTNPLLSDTVFGEQTFSEVGLAEIADTNALHDIVRRNLRGEVRKDPLVTFTQQP
jgi:prostaglandin-endoperoxide synthase 2